MEEIVWWARGDLNPGPPPCKGGVLTRLDDGPAPSKELQVCNYRRYEG